MSKSLRKITGPVILSRFGQVGAFDNEEQVPELQLLSWPKMFVKEATELGFDVDGMLVEASGHRIRLVSNDEWTGWEVLP